MNEETIKIINRIMAQNQDILDMNRIIIETLCPVEVVQIVDDGSDGGPTIQ